MLQLIDNSKLSVALIYNVDPRWSDADRRAVSDEANRLATGMREVGHPVTTAAVRSADLAAVMNRFEPGRHIVLNWCESLPGMGGSEAEVIRQLDTLGFTYTGSPADVVRISADKKAVRDLLASQGVPTPKGQVFSTCDVDGWTEFPAIVKSASEHCSLALTPESVVLNKAELRRRVTYMLERYGGEVLVEEFVDGKEYHVSVWGNEEIEVMPPAEMDFSAFNDVHDRLCTYDSKFNPASLHQQCINTVLPTTLTPEELQTLKDVSMAAYRVVGCRDYGRIDIRMCNSIFYVLDVNPNSDISSDASMAWAAEHLGLTFGQMGSRLIHLAAQRHPSLLPATAPA